MLPGKFLRTYFEKHRRVRLLVLLLCLMVSSAPVLADVPNTEQSLREQLSFMDRDAGLIFSLKVQQLHSAYQLASDAFPKERRALHLAGLGASAILGFYPFSTKAWTSSGFDVSSPILLQVAATEAGHNLAKTRIVLKVRSASRVQASVGRMRFREKARLGRKDDDSPRSLLAQVRKMPDGTQWKEALRNAGVFLIAKPAPLQGVLFARMQDGYLVLDLFDPRGLTFAQVLGILQRRPTALDLSMPGAWALRKGPIGLWIRSSQLGESLKDGSTACNEIASLGRENSIQAVGLAARIAPSRLTLDVAWSLRRDDTLLESLVPQDHALLGKPGLLSAHAYMASWGTLRDRARPSQAQSWDQVWANTKDCGTLSWAYVVSVAWPELMGLFLSELSILDRSAATVVDSIGGMSASIRARRRAHTTIVTEAWVRGAGANVAKSWLATLFGSEEKRGNYMQWGRASIRPYALDMPGGSVVGAGFRPGSRKLAHTSPRQKTVAGNVLAQLVARPAKLVRQLKDVPYSELWKRWQSLSAGLTKEGQALKLSIELRR